jgi:hypothetical protein
MPGKGKYTAYVGKKSPRRTMMERLYKNSPFKDLDETEAATLASELGNRHLLPSHQDGNPSMFPQGVSLDYQHPNSPDFDDVKWTKRGDPATAFFPNTESPGPGPDGQVNTAPPDHDPELSIADVKPNYVPGVPGTHAEGGTGTVNPSETTPRIAGNVVLGRDLPMGSSQKPGQ